MSRKRFTPEETLARLERAHRMSCSDPDDPNRTTLWGEGASAIRELLEQLADRQGPAPRDGRAPRIAPGEGLGPFCGISVPEITTTREVQHGRESRYAAS